MKERHMSSQTTKSKKQSTPAKKTKASPESNAAKKTSTLAKTDKSTKTATGTKTAKTETKNADGILDTAFDTNQIAWSINPKIYPLDVVYQAAFVFIDRAYMLLDVAADGTYLCTRESDV